MPERLTNAQRLIWSGQAMHPGSLLYNMILLFRIRGAIDSDAFEKALTSVIRASDVLGATLATDDGAVHLLENTASGYYEFVDLSDKADPELALRDWLKQRKHRAFDFSSSLIDCVLVRLDDANYAWYFNAHHLVTDGWSAGVVFDLVSTAYEAEIDGRLDELQLPRYASLVHFEDKVAAGERWMRSREYWNALNEQTFNTPVLYRRSTSLQSTSSTRRKVRLDDRRMEMLRRLAEDNCVKGLTQELSFHTILLTLLAVFVSRVSGSSQFAVSMPTHNRPTARFRQTVGVFVELLPIVFRVDQNQTFLDLASSTRTASQEFFQNALPGQGRPELNRRSSVVLNYVNASFESFAGIETKTKWLHCDHFDSNHSLRLHVHDFDRTGNLTLLLDFASDAFSTAQQDETIEHFLRLFDSFLEDPQQPVGKPSLVAQAGGGSEAESGGSSSGAGYSDTGDASTDGLRAQLGEEVKKDVLFRFDEVVRDNPQLLAVQDDLEFLTYRDLSIRADRFAAQLLSVGVAAGDRVAIYMERSVDFVASILGCMRVCAAYVPIEKSTASARVAIILEQADVSAIITADPSTSLPGIPVVNPLDLDHKHETTRPVVETNPDNFAAYVIFTSGSTGIPKGVTVSRRALSLYADWAGSAFGGPGAVTMPLFTSLSYDLAVTSVFVPLVTGGIVKVYRSLNRIGDASLVRQVLACDEHDVIKLTPSHILVAADLNPQLERLLALVLGGEALSTEIAAQFHNKLGGTVKLFNEYGPTEATVGCMIHEFDPDRDRADVVPIGVANPYSEVFLMDDFGNEVPSGVVAELVIGGGGLADGYLHKTVGERESFIRHPKRPGETIYRTGDAAVRDESGTFTYLGRLDDQVKISGVRIELGEIEARLQDLDGVLGAAVVSTGKSISGDEEVEQHCSRCGLSTLHPGSDLDSTGICNICRRFDKYADRASSYFRKIDEFKRLFAESRGENQNAQYDCMALLSGGKDSTYVLGQLVDMGLRVHAFTLDNGFISDQAIANIKRVVDELGVSHEFATTEAMNAVFVDSLRRYSNVCNGCFKVIYTLALRRAEELGIPIIVTGLSRGQFFETRLTPELFETVEHPLEQIDTTVLAARKAYHKVKDAVRDHIDTTFLRDGELLDEIRFVDFFRYSDVSLDEMLAYLDERLPWVRPSDTGRSTNCLINDVGIYVHKKERGYHNYSWPYSWDVRIGHKNREAALEELDDQIDEENTLSILKEIGYTIRNPRRTMAEAELEGFYVSKNEIDEQQIRRHLARTVPSQAIPKSFTRVDSIPLTPNGKIDRKALVSRRLDRTTAGVVRPSGEIEEIVHEIWCELLGVSQVSTTSHFLDSGGNSILAIQVISRITHAFDIELPFSVAFQAPTIQDLAELVEQSLISEIDNADGAPVDRNKQ